MFRTFRFSLFAYIFIFLLQCSKGGFSSQEVDRFESSLNAFLSSQKGISLLKEIHLAADTDPNSSKIGDLTRKIIYDTKLKTDLRNRIINYMNRITDKKNKDLAKELTNSRSIIRVLSNTVNGHLVRNGYEKVYQ
ncbi:MAG: hypothetical protein AAF518_22710 [Spirochaetota bacterium]